MPPGLAAHEVGCFFMHDRQRGQREEEMEGEEYQEMDEPFLVKD